MNFLGEMAASGRGAFRDYGKALEWFRAGAAKGDPDCRNNLGELYAGGLGVPQDFRQAAGWFREAAAGSGPARWAA